MNPSFQKGIAGVKLLFLNKLALPEIPKSTPVFIGITFSSYI